MISVIVPCYNEQESLPIFYDSFVAEMKGAELSYELLLVDDGSSDETRRVMKELAERDGSVHWLSFSRNFGKEAAIYAGLCNAGGDYIAVIDADMQDPPSLLPKMARILDGGEYDCVATRRVDRAGEPPVRSFFARRFYRLINRISETEFVDGARDYRMMKRKVVDSILKMGEYNRFSKGIFEWVGYRTCWMEYENVGRVAGETKWSFWGLVKYAINGIINFSSAPLDIASFFGFFMTFIAFVMLIFIIVRRLIFGDPVAGWASTICVIIFIGGIQLFCIGIIGQYLSKTYLETKHRPVFIVGDTDIDNAVRIR